MNELYSFNINIIYPEENYSSEEPPLRLSKQAVLSHIDTILASPEIQEQLSAICLEEPTDLSKKGWSFEIARDRIKDQKYVRMLIEFAKVAGKSFNRLDLEYSEITSLQLIELLSLCPNLHDLKLTGCDYLTRIDLRPLAHLQTLNLSDCSNLKIIDYFTPSLTALDLSNCCNLYGKYLAGRLPASLLSLSLSSCFRVRERHLLNLPESLKFLDLSRLQISEDVLKALPSGLESFAAAGCGQFQIAALDRLKSLISLDLSRNLLDKEESEPPLPLFSSLSPTLETLNVSDMENLSDEDLQALPSGLKRINLSKCSLVTDRYKELLSQSVEINDSEE